MNIWIQIVHNNSTSYINLNQMREVIFLNDGSGAQIRFTNGTTKSVTGDDNIQALKDALFMAYDRNQLPF